MSKRHERHPEFKYGHEKPCIEPDCQDTVGRKGAKGRCSKHYAIYLRGSRPKMQERSEEHLWRFLLVKKGWAVTESGCWEWSGEKDTHGYGRVSKFRGRRGRRSKLAHRISYEMFNGPLVEGEDICHKCDNPPCVNPNHLFSGTRRENVDDARRKGRLFRPCIATGVMLTLDQRQEICDRFQPRLVTASALAAEYNVTEGHITAVIAWGRREKERQGDRG